MWVSLGAAIYYQVDKKPKLRAVPAAQAPRERPARQLALAPLPDGVTCLVTGTGRPVTVFLPGLGGAAEHLRPLGSGVPGSRVFCELSGPPAPDDYAGLATAFRYGRGRAWRFSGVWRLAWCWGSTALLSETPQRFSRVVLYLPSAFTTVPRVRLEQIETMLLLAEAADVDGLGRLLGEELPAAVRAPGRRWRRAEGEPSGLPGREGLRLLKNLATGVAPVEGSLADVTAQVLVIAAAGDAVHPVEVAEEIATSVPYSRLMVFPTPAPLWDARRELRALVSGWLGG